MATPLPDVAVVHDAKSITILRLVRLVRLVRSGRMPGVPRQQGDTVVLQRFGIDIEHAALAAAFAAFGRAGLFRR